MCWAWASMPPKQRLALGITIWRAARWAIIGHFCQRRRKRVEGRGEGVAGRPSKLTPEIQKQICELLEGGNFVETVCDYVGISKETFYDWIRRGERGWEADIKGGYVEFSDAVKKAIAKVEKSTVAELR